MLFSPIQNSFLGLRSFQSVSSLSNRSISPKTTLAPLMPMTAALISSAAISSLDCPAKSSICCMHLTASRTARTRSIGDGVPPCCTWPGTANRDSKRPLDSSRIMLAMISVVYVFDACSLQRINFPARFYPFSLAKLSRRCSISRASILISIPSSGVYTAVAPIDRPAIVATYPDRPPCVSTTNTRRRVAEADCLIASQ